MKKNWSKKISRLCPFKEPDLCSLAGRYDSPILTQFLAPIDCSKISAQSILLSLKFAPAHPYLPPSAYIGKKGDFIFSIILSSLCEKGRGSDYICYSCGGGGAGGGAEQQLSEHVQ